MEDKWYLEHEDVDCTDCEDSEGSYPLQYFIGSVKGRQAYRYTCTNPECDHDEIIFVDELYTHKNGDVVNLGEFIGKKVTLTDGKQRVLKKDDKGFYVSYENVKSYVDYHYHSGRFAVTGSWDHKD